MFFEIVNTINRDLTIQLETLKEYSQSNDVYVTFDSFRSNRARLESNDINYIVQNELSCEKPINLIYSRTSICISNPELYNEIYAKHQQKLHKP
ncbi:hypothetical protein D3C74_414520 [compost metagenome]